MNKPRQIREWDETETHRDQWLPLILDFQDGSLGASERITLEQHLKVCGICQADLDGMRQTVTLLQRLPERPAPHSFTITPLQARRLKPSPIYRFSEFAAAIAAAFLIFAFALDLSGAFTPAAPPKPVAVVTADPTATLEPVGTLAGSTANNGTNGSNAGLSVDNPTTSAATAASPTAQPQTTVGTGAATSAATTSNSPDLRLIEIVLVIATLLFTVFALMSRPRAPGRLKI